MAVDGTMEIRRMKLAELTPAPYNPRQISEQARFALTRSLERFGLVQPIVWNKRSGNVVGGHRRLEILMEFGIEETDVVVKDLDHAEEKALNLVLNNAEAQGFFTDPDAILAEIRASMPDAYDELMLWKIHGEMEEKLGRAEAGEDDGGEDVPGLSPEPYESYNYIVLLFRNEIDWTAAVDHFGLEPVRHTWAGEKAKHKIGLGRVVEGREYIGRMLKDRA